MKLLVKKSETKIPIPPPNIKEGLLSGAYRRYKIVKRKQIWILLPEKLELNWYVSNWNFNDFKWNVNDFKWNV